LKAIADGVVLVGAVEGVVGAVVGVYDLAILIIGPRNRASRLESGPCLGDIRPLAQCIHAVAIAGNHGGANFVFLGGEDVASEIPKLLVTVWIGLVTVKMRLELGV